MLDSRLVKQAIGCLAAFFGVNPGEALSALANILGGIIGALGAALAVYLTLKGQRKDARRQQEDERQRTSSAINREVAEFSRLAIGHLEICEHMHSGTTMIPARDLPAIMKLPEPIIYAGNADNIGRLANAQTVVGFFTRIHEVESLTRIAAQSFGPMPLDQSNLATLAQAWMHICQLGRAVLVSRLPRSESDFDTQIRTTLVADINKILARAAQTFPEETNEA